MPVDATELPGRPSVLIAGLPRSGTTWVANALARADGATLVHEPDNDRIFVGAMAAKADLGRYPCLQPGERADRYRRLLRAAFGVGTEGRFDERRRRIATTLVEGVDVADIDRAMGRSDARGWPRRLVAARLLGAPPVVTPADGPRIVKSVHCALALDWVETEVRPTATVVLVRHPANVIGSWMDMGWQLEHFGWHRAEVWSRFGPPEGNPGPGRPDTYVERAAWQFALLANALVMVAQQRSLPIVDHEDVLADPVGELRSLAGGLGLVWTDEATAWVEASNRQGEGYELNRRVDEERGRWRTRLPAEDLAAVADVVARFPLLRDRWVLG